MGSIRIEPHVFEPAIYSDEELNFFLSHLEQTPTAALHGALPAGVNPTAVRSLLDRLQEYDQLQKVHAVAWSGFDAIKDSILRYLAWRERTEEIYRRTGGRSNQRAIRHASQYVWDGSGNAYKFGIDADSAEMVRTEIMEDGSRRPFGVKMLEPEGKLIPSLEDIAPWVRTGKGAAQALADKVVIDQSTRQGTMKCTVCGRVESFDSKNRQELSAARARMSRHLKTAKNEVARHRLLHRKTYESPTRKA